MKRCCQNIRTLIALPGHGKILREVAMHPQPFGILVYAKQRVTMDVTGQLIKLFVNKSLCLLTDKSLWLLNSCL